MNDETALIQTLDFFTPIVDDPYLFGQIAAANALSDVYAMGGTPLLAMNIVGFPINSMDKLILKDIMAGGLSKIQEAGALLVGGHSLEDDEIKYGLSVTGTVHPDHVLLNSGAQPGDILILTKPLGTGILSTAIKGGLADTSLENNISRCMATLNKIPGDAIQGFAHGATDITGFGLLGHVHEMAQASNVGIKLDLNTIPLLERTREFANMGIIPEGGHKNLAFYNQYLSSPLADHDSMHLILADPQTSGGLLIATSPENSVYILNAINNAHYEYECVVIGEVLADHIGSILI